MKMRLLSAALAAVLLIGALSGCRARTPADHPSGDSPPTGDQESQPALRADARGYYASHRPHRWSADGRQLTFPHAGALHTLNTDNQLLSSITFPLPEGTEGLERRYSWNDSMVFLSRVAEPLQEQTRVVREGDGYRLVNAEICTRQGELVRALPAGSPQAVEESRRRYEASVSQGIGAVTWLDDDNLAINTQSHLYLYNVGTDTVTLVEDLTYYVNMGWTIERSSAFGARQGWAVNGTYYYTVCRELDADGESSHTLWAVRPGREPWQVLGEEQSFTFSLLDGELLVFGNWDFLGVPEDHPDYVLQQLDLWYLRLDGASRPVNLGPVLPGDYQVASDGRCIAYMQYRFGGEVEQEFVCVDTETGETTRFSPASAVGALPPEQGAYGLIAAFAHQGSVRFLFGGGTEEVADRTDAGEVRFMVPLWLHDTATGRTVEAGLIDGVGDSPLNPQGTHLVDGLDQIRILPLPVVGLGG